jgi:membrane protease YdiL (CAAX protease family)
MTARSTAIGRAAGGPIVAARPWLASVALFAGLGVIVGARWAATRAGLDPLVVGVVFGVGLVALFVVGRRGLTVGVRRSSWTSGRWALVAVVPPLVVGAVAGIALVAITLAGPALTGSIAGPGIGRPAAAFLPWAAITFLVASGEEAVLRGRAFDAVRRARGLPAAIVLTTIAFALMHVPLYGWHVVPLDLAVGLGFAGLRIATRGIAAPVAAHAVADLATWWL